MKNNEQGGILSNLIIIPAALVLMVGFFFLGYYVGRHESKPGKLAESLPPLPEVVSRNMPKPEEFTFYKTLTEKENRTVSIDLKHKSADAEQKAEKKQVVDAPKDNGRQATKGKGTEGTVEKGAAPAHVAKQTSVKKPQAHEKATAPLKQANGPKVRFTIQISSYPEKTMADDEVKSMKRNGYAAFIVSSDIPDKGTWYRVRLGSFTKKEAAEKLLGEVRAKTGTSPIVVLE